ncbi:MAG: lipid A deacylase LpxR family protein [Pseudobdellovibrio sp.]
MLNLLFCLFSFNHAFSSEIQTDKGIKNEVNQKPALGTPGQAFGFSVENDARVMGGPGSDQAYTNGFKFSYSYSENQVPEWANATVKKYDYFKSELNHTKINFGLALAQQIYSPANTGTNEFIPDDRRYAAWTYLGFSSQIKTLVHANLIELDIGLVGPSAYGEQVQNTFHKQIKSSLANGWVHQLSDEPTLQLSYQQKLKFFEISNKSGKYFDAIPYYGLGLGNVHIGSHLGGLLRLGISLPDDFGPSRLSASDGESFVAPKTYTESFLKNIYIFTGFRGNAVAHDIFLDGNTFRPNRTVHKKVFTLENEFGVGFQYDHWNIVWRFVSRTPEFEERQKYNSFASVNIMYSMGR